MEKQQTPIFNATLKVIQSAKGKLLNGSRNQSTGGMKEHQIYLHIGQHVIYRTYMIAAWPPKVRHFKREKFNSWIYLVIRHTTHIVRHYCWLCRSLASPHKNVSPWPSAHIFKARTMIANGKGAHACATITVTMSDWQARMEPLYSPRRQQLPFRAAATHS